MLNLGFFELTLFGIIALIVLGPEKLPIAARQLGKWYGKIRRMSARLQHELVSELELLEVQNELKAEIAKIRESEAKMKAQMQALEKNLAQSQENFRHNTYETMDSWQPIEYIDSRQPAKQTAPTNITKPMTNHFFLLGDYDKKRRLPKAPWLPNYQADKLLYQHTNHS